MATARVTFHRLHQGEQEYGSNQEYMVSRVFFALEVDGESKGELYADIKQTVGANFEKDPLEVGVPVGYRGPWNHEAFSKEAENYFRGFFGSKGASIRTLPGSGMVLHVRGSNHVREVCVEFPVEGAAGW